MCNYDNSSPTVTNCTFSGNSADMEGGGMHNWDSSPTVTNCTFSGNSAERGGGMHNINNSSPTVTNCTFSGNSASGQGGGMYNYNNSSPTVTNCIFWDGGDEIYNHGTSTPVVTYCDVQGGYSGAGNIDVDPLFVNPAADDYHLQAGSPCIDAGDNTAVPVWLTTDFEGDPRIIDGDGDTVAVVDMGADEYVPLANNQPNIPSDPSPADGATGVSINTDLSWTGGDLDVEDIVTYDVYFGTNSTSPFKETIGPYAANQTSISYSPGTLSYNTSYYWKIVASDNHGITNGGLLWNFTTTLSSYDIDLAEGWNLISLPLIPNSTNITDIINAENLASGNMDNVDLVYYFDTASETWLWWNGAPASTLTTMEDGLGYWMLMSGADTLTVQGTKVGDPPPEYGVIVGWNMIGFTSTAAMAPEVYLASAAGDYTLLYGWDAVGETWLWWNGAPASTLTTMEPGDGYWILMDNPGIITPP